MDINLLEKKTEEVNKIIYSYLPEGNIHTKLITEAVAYSVKAGGKRLRPLMMKEAYEMLGGNGAEDILHALMAAIEFIHTYSLVHDDLPAMDDDDLRRGQPTTHAKYGEAFGILAGDALLNTAFSLALNKLSLCDDDEIMFRGLMALRVIADKAGIDGMIGGQCLDVLSEKNADKTMTSEEITYIYENKTSALLEASVMAGAILAGAPGDALACLEEVAFDVGMAFQIRDDILDITSTDEEIGKPAGSDEKNNKATYVSLYGLENAKKDVEMYSQRALRKLNEIDENDSFLKELIIYLIDRRS